MHKRDTATAAASRATRVINPPIHEPLTANFTLHAEFTVTDNSTQRAVRHIRVGRIWHTRCIVIMRCHSVHSD
jgi:hypothetical protein